MNRTEQNRFYWPNVIRLTSNLSILLSFNKIIYSCRTAWVQKIKGASEQYIETEKKKHEKAYQGDGLRLNATYSSSYFCVL